MGNCINPTVKKNIDTMKKKIQDLELMVENLRKENIGKEQDKYKSVDTSVNNVTKTRPTPTPKIPSHLRQVNPQHLPLLKGYKMICPAVGNGACGTNCGLIHIMEDNDKKSSMQMKRKINEHIADHYDSVYKNVIGLPYTETVFGEKEMQVCNTPEELKEFLRSDRGLQVYSNMQEMQAMSNIFNMAIDVFTYGTRIGIDGQNYQVSEWMERILPMAEAINLAEYREGHFPPMALYHSNDNHFDLLVADNSRLVTNGLLGSAETASVQQEEWQTVSTKATKNSSFKTPMTSRNKQKKTADMFPCDECDSELESKGLLDAHKFNHNELRLKSKFTCDDCNDGFSSEDELHCHMKEEHDDGSWTCNDCQFQTNTSEGLRQHLKKNGHQPSESSVRQTNEMRKCYTCKKEFEGYTAMMNHRYKNHPSNKTCKNIPICTGWVNGNRCWYVHPELSGSSNKTTEETQIPLQPEKETECKRCGMKFPSKNQFMEHYISEHASHIVCRNWVKDNCQRSKC